ncbi:MAG: AfsA-related hotdog domain-containing protein [Microbacterium sp.]|uniref:AfsA-related hotdog domain-containing protein n=1 Tax=Microbacterium sp. TaxID=51671 RepID=UPI0039E70B4E
MAHKLYDRSLWLRTAEVASNGALDAMFGMPATGGEIRFADIMEVQRQAGIVHAHYQLGVPADDVFVVNSIELRVFWPATSVPVRTVRGRIRVHATEASRARSRVRSAVQRFSVEGNGGLRAEGSSSATFIPRAVFPRVRARRSAASPAVEPMRRGAVREEPLVVDHADPILADHEVEHVSAMSVVCAIERSVREHEEARLSRLSLRFLGYCDADPAPILRTRIVSGREIGGMLTHGGAVYAEFSGGLTTPLPQRRRT